MATAAETVVERKQYPARKACSNCGRRRAISKFRLLSSGYRQAMCGDCERDYERDRWHSRDSRSREQSGNQATRRRRAAAAVRAG